MLILRFDTGKIDKVVWLLYQKYFNKTREYVSMNKKLGLLAAVILSVSLLGSAYAHKGQIVGDYKIDAGWKNEPPIALASLMLLK